MLLDERKLIGVDEILQIGADVPLQMQPTGGVAHGQVKGRHHGGVKLAVRHGAFHQVRASRQLAVNAVDVGLGQVRHRAVTQALVTEDVGIAVQLAHDLLALQIVGQVKGKGDHGLGQHVLGHQGVPGKADVVGCDKTHMVRRMAGGADHLQLCAAQLYRILVQADHPVHRADQMLQAGDGADHPHGEVEEMVFQALFVPHDVRLQLRQADSRPIGFLEIPGAFMVVIVHVGAGHPHRGPAHLF